MRFSRVRGTQDFLDLKMFNFVIKQVREHLTGYNFAEIKTPILEHTNLFTRSLGEQTDVVTKEMYVFETAGGDSICLRPEATAGTIRAFFENRVDKSPWKVWSYGPMFRHERPQKGRWRQFTQVNIEVVNSNPIEQDAYFIKMLDNFFKNRLFLENYVLKLNFLGCKGDRKSHRDALKEYLDSVNENLCKTCLVRKEKNILRVFDCKEEGCQAVYRDAPKLTDHLCDGCEKEWNHLCEVLQLLSVSFVNDPLLVRGLDYYHKTVFEFSSKDLGAQNAFCGGGRYDLSEEMGAKKKHSSVGAAIGLGRLLMLLEGVKEKLAIPQDPALHMIIPMSEEQKTLALILADVLHDKGVCADILLDGGNMKNMMRRTNKAGASHVLILGETEQQDGTVTVKNMTTGENRVVKQVDVVSFLKGKKV